jgi:hypothetical protein
MASAADSTVKKTVSFDPANTNVVSFAVKVARTAANYGFACSCRSRLFPAWNFQSAPHARWTIGNLNGNTWWQQAIPNLSDLEAFQSSAAFSLNGVPEWVATNKLWDGPSGPYTVFGLRYDSAPMVNCVFTADNFVMDVFVKGVDMGPRQKQRGEDWNNFNVSVLHALLQKIR